MGAPVARVSEELPNGHGRALLLWCPGCESMHQVHFGGTTEPRWDFDGNIDAPTISPSLLVRGVQWSAEYPEMQKPRHNVAAGQETVCHSFIRAGQWEYLSDCTHPLAGQTVPCEPIPD